mgnify:CR=1 FL=1
MTTSASEIHEDLILRVEQQGGFIALPVIREGTVAVVLRNGRVDRVITPGREFMFRLPFQSVEILLVDTKIRELKVVSEGECLTNDMWRVNISLRVSYRVIDAACVAVQYAQPVQKLYTMVKDLLGQVVNQQNFITLSQQGRIVVRRDILNLGVSAVQPLGIELTDVRIDDLTLPERVGESFDNRNVAPMDGEADQWQLRGKWQDMPESVQLRHMQEQAMRGAVFVNPPFPGAAPGTGYGGAPIPAPHPAGRLPAPPPTTGLVAPTTHLSTEVWGQLVLAGTQQIYTLSGPEVTIGRAPDNTIILQDTAVSGHHARLERQGDNVILIDLNSYNGTFVNGARVQHVRLVGEETIKLGSVQFQFHLL